MDLTTASRGELLTLIYQLTDKVGLLEGEIAKLRELLQQKGEKGAGGKQPKTPPDFVIPILLRFAPPKAEKSGLDGFIPPKPYYKFKAKGYKANILKRLLTPRKKREAAYVRTKETPTERVFHSVSVCPDCGAVRLGKPTHNNHGERILRHTVIARKIQGGTRSAKGSKTKTILTSLFDTWQLQGKNPLAECRLLLSSC